MFLVEFTVGFPFGFLIRPAVGRLVRLTVEFLVNLAAGPLAGLLKCSLLLLLLLSPVMISILPTCCHVNRARIFGKERKLPQHFNSNIINRLFIGTAYDYGVKIFAP